MIQPVRLTPARSLPSARFSRGRLINPPINDDEWLPLEAVHEADADSIRRRNRAFVASREIRTDRNREEREAIARLLTRLRVLRRELRAVLVSAATDFRKSQASTLIGEVDELIQQAERDIATSARRSYQRAFDLGASHADDPIRAAQLIVTTSPRVDPVLVEVAFENTVDLLSEHMRQFRNRIAVQVRRLATIGSSFPDQMANLARELDANGIANAEFSAERILRTELSRVFNSATFERLNDLASRMPFLRKIWIRTADHRTRPTHVSAGGTYARGKGIPIPMRFSVGKATLRFPVDPLAEPSGRASAEETIMCRCNSAVDFELNELRASTAARVSIAMGRTPPITIPPGQAPPTTAAIPVVLKVKKPRPPSAKPTPPLVPPKPVSDALTIPGPGVSHSNPGTARVYDEARAALAIIDGLHRDGALPKIPVMPFNDWDHASFRGTSAFFRWHSVNLEPRDIGMNRQATHPRAAFIHETGHFLDYAGFGSGQGFATSGKFEDRLRNDPVLRTRFKAVEDAIYNSNAIQGLHQVSQRGYFEVPVNTPSGTSTVTMPVNRAYLNYVLDPAEQWARAYTQYVTVRSKDRTLQQWLTEKIDRQRRTPHKAMWQWESEDFKPIRRAIDRFFTALGWTKRKTAKP